jgi:hypothetical protein
MDFVMIVDGLSVIFCFVLYASEIVNLPPSGYLKVNGLVSVILVEMCLPCVLLQFERAIGTEANFSPVLISICIERKEYT